MKLKQKGISQLLGSTLHDARTGIGTGTSSQSSRSIFDKIGDTAKNTIEKATNTIGTAVDTVKSITDIGVIIVSLISDPGLISANLSRLRNLTGYELSSDEWITVIHSLNGNYQLQHIKSCCERVMASRLEAQEALRVKTAIETAQQEICASVIMLSKPIFSRFQESQIQRAYHELNSNFGERFLELCKGTANALQECMPPDPPLPPNARHNNRSNPVPASDGSSYTDAYYLNIVRKYILFLNETPAKLISKFQQLNMFAVYGQKILVEQANLIDHWLGINVEKIDIGIDEILPLQIAFLFMMWCAMSYELMTAAYGDISVDKQTLLLSCCNLFVVLQFALLSREGLVIDGGISGIVAKSVKTGYAVLHDVVLPITDLGVSYMNVYLERTNSNWVITRTPSWNKTLSYNIHGEEGHTLKMHTALNMLHTFRVADAFLSTILSDNAFCIKSLKDGLMKLSPIPLNGEENKLLALFWRNPYKELPSAQSSPRYGVFFNYNKEIDVIYEKHCINMGRQLTDVLIAANNVYYEIHELNNRIGKGDPSIIDNYLIFCIAGRLIDKYNKPCIYNISQHQLAWEIYQHIHRGKLCPDS